MLKNMLGVCIFMPSFMDKWQEILYKIIGERIKQYRELSGITQDLLGKKCGVSRSTISNFEANNHQAPIHTLYKVSRALSVSIIDLLPTEEEIQMRLSEESSAKVYEQFFLDKNISSTTKDTISQYL